MVEIFNITRTQFLGRFPHFKDAPAELDRQRQMGKLPSETPSVLVYSYKTGELQRISRADLCGTKWRFTELWTAPKKPAARSAVPTRLRQTPAEKFRRTKKWNDQCRRDIGEIFTIAQRQAWRRL